jgi:hypothetical protein
MDETLKKFLEWNGYSDLRVLPDGRIVGIMKMLFTFGLFVDLNAVGYNHRYCYENYDEAKTDCDSWDGTGDPHGNWIKCKGKKVGDYQNPSYT